MKDEVVAAQAASVIIAIGPTNSFLQMTFFVCYSIKIIGYFFFGVSAIVVRVTW